MSHYDETHIEHVTYICDECGRSRSISGESMRDVAAEFESAGWENHQVKLEERSEYIVLCPDHNTKAILDHHIVKILESMDHVSKEINEDG